MRLRVVLDGRVIADRFPGIGRYVVCLADALARTGEVELTLLWRPAAANTRYALDARDFALHAVDVAPFTLAEQMRLPAVARRLRPDVWHAPYYVMPYRRLGCPTVVTFYDTTPLALPSLWPRHRRVLFALAHRLALRRATRALAVSEATRRDLVERFGVDPARVTVTPLAAAPHFQPPRDAERARVRRAYDLPARFVLAVATCAPSKNLPRLIDAFRRLRTASPELDYACVIAGAADAGPVGADVRPRGAHARRAADARPAGADPSVRFLGRVPEADLPALYACADLFVAASLSEGFGLPVLEAMACGTPVACADAASLPEVVGDAAVLFDPWDADAIAGAIGQVMADAELRTDLRGRGLQRAAHFTWGDVARRTVEAYHVAIAERKGEAGR